MGARFAAVLLTHVAFAAACSRSSAPTIGSDPEGTKKPHDAAPPAPPPKPELPPGWDPVAMSMDPPSPLRVSLVIAYRSLVDDRPLYLDEAIVWVHSLQGDAQSESWRLMHVYRHPNEDHPEAWHLSIIYDADDYEPSDSYDHAPTVDEAKMFFAATWWWDRDDSFRTLAAGMPASSWRTAFHADPIDAPPKNDEVKP